MKKKLNKLRAKPFVWFPVLMGVVVSLLISIINGISISAISVVLIAGFITAYKFKKESNNGNLSEHV